MHCQSINTVYCQQRSTVHTHIFFLFIFVLLLNLHSIAVHDAIFTRLTTLVSQSLVELREMEISMS